MSISYDYCHCHANIGKTWTVHKVNIKTRVSKSQKSTNIHTSQNSKVKCFKILKSQKSKCSMLKSQNLKTTTVNVSKVTNFTDVLLLTSVLSFSSTF